MSLRPRGDEGQHHLGRRIDAERAEMMLADPGGMHAELFGIDRLVGDLLINSFGVRGLFG